MKQNELVFLLSLVIGLNISCFQEKKKVTIINEDTFEVDSDNEKIKLSVKDAQEKLDYFITELSKHSKDTNYWFSAKISFESQEKVEHMWINTFRFSDNTFIGILISEPRWNKDVKVGDTIFTEKENIEDWYISNDNLNIEEGNFTEKYLFDN